MRQQTQGAAAHVSTLLDVVTSLANRRAARCIARGGRKDIPAGMCQQKPSRTRGLPHMSKLVDVILPDALRPLRKAQLRGLRNGLGAAEKVQKRSGKRRKRSAAPLGLRNGLGAAAAPGICRDVTCCNNPLLVEVARISRQGQTFTPPWEGPVRAP